MSKRLTLSTRELRVLTKTIDSVLDKDNYHVNSSMAVGWLGATELSALRDKLKQDNE